MASAGGKEVGRVSIRVVPNTDGFKEKVERDLKDLDGERIRVRPDFDSDDLERQIDRSDTDVEVEAKLKDEDKLKSKLKETTSKIKETVQVSTELNERGFRAKLRAMIESAKSKLVMDATIDSTGIGAQALAIRSKAQSLLGKIKAKVDFDENGATAKAIAWAKTTSKAMTLRVRTVLDSRQLRESLKGIGHLSEVAVRPFYRMFGGEIIEGLVKGFTRFKGAIAIATLGVSALGVAFAPMIVSAVKAASALVQVTAALAPSVVAAAALSYGALYKSFQGFGNALKAQSLEEFNEAVAGMGPNARQAATSLYDLKQAYNRATSGAQEKFWGNVRTDLSRLTPAVDMVGAAVTKLSGRFGRATDSVASFFASDRGMRVLTQNIGGASKAAGDLVDSLAGFIPGLSAVGAAGATTFSKITQGIATASREWSNKMLASLESGSLQRAMDRNVETLKTFWTNTKNVGAIVGGVFSSMTRNGQGLLAPLTGIVQSTADWVQSAEGVQALDGFFGSIGKAMETIAPVVAEVAGTVIKDVVPALSEMIVAAGPGMERMGTAISNALKDIAPQLPAIGEGLGNFLSAAAPIVEKIGPAVPVLFGVAAGFKTIGAVKGVGKSLGAVGKGLKALRGNEKLGSMLKGVGRGVSSVGSFAKRGAPKILGFGKNLGKMGGFARFAGKGLGRLVPGVGIALTVADAGRLLVKHWEPAGRLADDVRQRWSKGMERAKANLDKAPERIGKAADRAKEKFGKAWDGIRDRFKKGQEELNKRADETNTTTAGLPSPAEISARLSDIKSRVVAGMQQLGPALVGVWDGIKAQASAAWDGIGNLIGTVWDGVKDLWSLSWTAIGTALSTAWDQIKNYAVLAWTGASQMLGTVWDGLQTVWSVAWTVIQTVLTTAWDFIKNYAVVAWTGVSTLISSVWDPIVAVWTAVWEGISSTLSSIWTSIQSTATSAFSSISSAVTSAWDTVVSATSSAWSSVSSAVSSAVGTVISAAADMASNVISSVSNAASSIVSTISSAMSSFVSAVSSGFSQAVSLAASLPGRVRGAMGNLGGMLVSSGRALVQGFINGITSMIGAVASAASSVVQAARNFFPFSPAKEGPFSGRGYTTYSGKALVKDFAGGMTSEIGSVKDASRKVAAAGNEFTKAVNAPFEKFHHDKVLQPVLESNAEKIAKSREKEAEAEKKHLEKLAEINKDYEEQSKKISDSKDDAEKQRSNNLKATEKQAEKIAKENKRYAEQVDEIRKSLDEDLEAPDYSDIERSFNGFYVEGMRGMLAKQLEQVVKSEQLVQKTRQGALAAVRQAQATFGDHPIYAKVEANVNAEHFEYAFSKAIEESGISAVPVEFVISNLQQLKQDLGMGDGVISRAIDQAAAWNWNNTDAKRYRDDPKTEVHYHVEDMQEAIRRENLRVRKQMMKMR